MVMARVQPDKRAALTSALDGLFADAGESSRPYSVSDELMVVSDSPSHLAWAVGHLGQGAGSPFAAAIARSLQARRRLADRRGRGSGHRDGGGRRRAADRTRRHDGREVPLPRAAFPSGAEENEVTVTFQDARTGMASWLADGGSGGAAEYLPADALLAGYVSMREPGQLFQEFTALMTKEQPSFQNRSGGARSRSSAPASSANLTAAMGTEAAFALHGFSASGPAWVMVAWRTTRRSSTARSRSWWTRSTPSWRADEQDKRCVLGAGERERTDVERR